MGKYMAIIMVPITVLKMIIKQGSMRSISVLSFSLSVFFNSMLINLNALGNVFVFSAIRMLSNVVARKIPVGSILLEKECP